MQTMRTPDDEHDKRRRRGLLRLLISVWKRLKGRRRRKAEDIITRNFFGQDHEEGTHATTISPTSSIDTLDSAKASVESQADSPDRDDSENCFKNKKAHNNFGKVL